MKNIPTVLKAEEHRYTYYPIKYPVIHEAWKDAESKFWKASEIDLSRDREDFENRLNDDERHFIKHVLAFFAASDGIVNENLAENFITECQPAEVKAFYGFQIMMENVHSESYSLLIDSIVSDSEEQNRLFNALDTMSAVMKKGKWALKWIESDNFSERLIAFAAVEGIFFSGSFCAIYYLCNNGRMPGLLYANKMISRDEQDHCHFAATLYNHDQLIEPEFRLSEERVLEIIIDAVKIEEEFVSEALPVALIGMNADLMKQYIQFVADVLLANLGYKPYFNVTSPFSFMNEFNLKKKENFFETRVSNYIKASGSVSDVDFDNDEFDL